MPDAHQAFVNWLTQVLVVVGLAVLIGGLVLLVLAARARGQPNLVNCPGCGNGVAPQASTCPHCGQVLSN